jgi:hypothetical protein
MPYANEPNFKGIDFSVLLQDVAKLKKERGFRESSHLAENGKKLSGGITVRKKNKHLYLLIVQDSMSLRKLMSGGRRQNFLHIPV